MDKNNLLEKGFIDTPQEPQENNKVEEVKEEAVKTQPQKKRGRRKGYKPTNVKYRNRYILKIKSLGIQKQYASINAISKDLNLPMNTLYRLYNRDKENSKYKYSRKGSDKWLNYEIVKINSQN